MRLIADAHVHVYPFYAPGVALATLRRNLAALDERARCLAFLAERFDCHFFADFAREPSRLIAAPVRVEVRGESLLLQEQGFPDLYIFAGRQIVTRERIEVLALTVDAGPPDGLSAEETIAGIRERGGVPVLSWAPGKWFFARGKVVARLLERFAPGTLLVGDTGLRPRGWPMPGLIQDALANGFGLVAGSDPLPVPGEEVMMGKYGIGMDAAFAPEDPVGSVRAMLASPGFRPRLRGERGGLVTVFRRLLGNSRARKEKGRAMGS